MAIGLLAEQCLHTKVGSNTTYNQQYIYLALIISAGSSVSTECGGAQCLNDLIRLLASTLAPLVGSCRILSASICTSALLAHARTAAMLQYPIMAGRNDHVVDFHNSTFSVCVHEHVKLHHNDCLRAHLPNLTCDMKPH